ncbi:hypothetical protein LTR60_000997 [Cryomyces antarcticus]|nr:hypothetical protein LTR60_000997 [Cryomyces antarcticus]
MPLVRTSAGSIFGRGVLLHPLELAAMATAAEVENWDEDIDFQGDLFTHSVSTVQTSLSSRMSIRSESNVGDEDWQVLLSPDDDNSIANAISSVKQAGIPIPSNVPSSALLGGTIKRLTTKKSRQNMDDDWGDDLDLPGEGLVLKPKQQEAPNTPAADDQELDFDDWAEGSLGIRFGGTRHEERNRSSSVSVMSPSLDSCMTVESEDDGLGGLVLPEGPMDFKSILEKRATSEVPSLTPDASPSPATQSHPPPPEPLGQIQKPPEVNDDDFFNDLDIGGGEVFDPNKLTLNRNIKQKDMKSRLPAHRGAATTLTFTDKPTATRIPRPVSGSKPTSRLDPVYESGATQITRPRTQPTNSGSQLLRSKRSMPVMRGQYSNPTAKPPPVPFLPAGIANSQSHHVNARPLHHLRRESDTTRPLSPPPRSQSRMSTAMIPDTPSRPSRRPDLAPAALAREAAARRTLTKPPRRRNFGDGSELEIFDDLPISATKESKFIKAPSGRGAPKTLRNQPSRSELSRLPIPDRFAMQTPQPPPMTPRGPLKPYGYGLQENTPRYLRDTTASRIARESRLSTANSGGAHVAGSRPRSEGPLMPVSTNWKAQVAARSPHTSPGATRGKGKGKPSQLGLIKPLGPTMAKTEKGMTYNPQTLRWEGNENALSPFDLVLPPPSAPPDPSPPTRPLSQLPPVLHIQQQHAQQPPPSPPRPALIAYMTNNNAVQVVGGMVFDPRRMCWLKMAPTSATHHHHSNHSNNNDKSNQLSPVSASLADEDEDDPFAGFDDLDDGPVGTDKDNPTKGTGKADEWLVGEEFDLGPEFIRRQRDEEVLWRRKVEAWFAEGGGVAKERCTDERVGVEKWRWAIRDIAAQMG